jgi:hypothetical protein
MVPEPRTVTVELLSLCGPLTEEHIAWIVDLYGPVDAKYRSHAYVRHQFVENPFGWSVNVFAVANGSAVGHCGVIPFRARRGPETFVAGKLEALAVDAAHRGRREEDGGSVATDILTRLYPFGVENGMEVVFGLAPPPVARIHVRAGCHLVPADAPAFTSIVDSATFGHGERSTRRRVAARGLGWIQRALLAAASAPLPTSTRIEQPSEDDNDLAVAPDDDRVWTVSGADSWDWFAGSGVLRALELPGRAGSRALVRLDETQPATVQIVAWRPRASGLAPAFRLLAAAAALGREHRAPTLRFQPWRGGTNEAPLARACVLTGFVRRPEAQLLVYPEGALADAVRLTPFFYVTF